MNLKIPLLICGLVSFSSASMGVLAEAATDTVLFVKRTGGSGPAIATNGTVSASGVTTRSPHALTGWAPGESGSQAKAVEAIAWDATNSYGVHAGAWYGTNTYALYGEADDGSGQNWAGYFNGNVAITGTCSPCTISDEKFKKNVTDLQQGLSRVMALRPKSYEMRKEEYGGRMVLPSGNQEGFLAQDLEKVMPNVVHSVVGPATLTPEELRDGVKKDPVSYKGVNYAAMIPVLVKAIQEQQAEIEALRAEVRLGRAK